MPMKRRAYHLVRVYKWLEAIQTMRELTAKEQLIIDYILSRIERLYQ